MNIRDTLERLFWTLVAAFLGALGVGDLLDISTLDAAVMAAAGAGVNFLLLIARARLAVLPEPGEGLPGLPTDNVNIEERLLPYDPEHTTRDRGAVDWRTVALVALAAVAILWALSLVPAEVAI